MKVPAVHEVFSPHRLLPTVLKLSHVCLGTRDFNLHIFSLSASVKLFFAHTYFDKSYKCYECVVCLHHVH